MTTQLRCAHSSQPTASAQGHSPHNAGHARGRRCIEHWQASLTVVVMCQPIQVCSADWLCLGFVVSVSMANMAMFSVSVVDKIMPIQALCISNAMLE